MVAIVAGNGLGVFNTSLNIVGVAGVLGQSTFGQGTNRAFINAVSGNLILQAQDAVLAGCGTDLLAWRTYNSLGAPTDVDEDGWRWGCEQTVKFQGPGAPLQPGAGAAVVRTGGDGHETVYSFDSARAAYVATEGSGAHDELTYDGNASEWVWTDGSLRVTERYSNSTSPAMTGLLVRRTDTSNNSIAHSYDNGRLTRIRDTASQQELRLTYGQFNGRTRPVRLEARALDEDANGHPIATLGDPMRLADYDYDSRGRLTTVTRFLTPNDGRGPAGAAFVTNYGYDDSSTRIASVTQSDGTTLSFTYDAAGRVSAVTDHGGAPDAQLALAYGIQPNSTAITDGNGKVWTYRHDGIEGRLIEVLTPPVAGSNLSTKFQYDSAGNLRGVTDPQNNVVISRYDAAGNRELERDAAGNTTTRTFNSVNQVVTETRFRIADPDGGGPNNASDPVTTRYVYDTNSRLRFLVSAEGRVTENRYGSRINGFGLVTETLLYVGQLFDVSGLGPAQQLTEAQLTDWVAGLPDMTQVQLTEYRYDLRGNMSQQTSYATVSAAGGGVLDAQASVAEYVHDAQSSLLEGIAVRGAARDLRTVVSSFTYDGITRVLTSKDENGLQTTVYDDANRSVTVTTASGLSETREHDSRGRLVSVRQSDGADARRTRYVYDNADRPRMIEDAQGGRRFNFYDAAGRLEFKVDATGAVTRFERDAAGLLVRQTQYRNRADAAAWFDSATDTVTKASLTAGGAGSDVIVDAARDRVTTFKYDGAGRLTASTDAIGTVTTIAYDGLSRVVMTQTGDRVTRYLYDKDNRRVGIIDALGYFTEYKYDAGGRLVETVRYSHRSPAAANMSAPVWIGATQQTVVAGRPFSYRIAAYDADGDPLVCSAVGPVPPWVRFDADTATLHGTAPATAATAAVTLRVEDSRGGSADVTLPLTVVPSPAANGRGAGPEWAPVSPLDIAANAPVNVVVPAAVGTSLTYAVAEGLPTGLSFDSTARTLTGHSSAVGFYSVLLEATDAAGHSTDRTLSVRIRSAVAIAAQPTGSDQPSAWRPADTSGLRSYLFYDGQGRVVGAVDEQQFLTETVYDEALNKRRTLRYLSPVVVAVDDTVASVRSRAGAARTMSLIRFDAFGRVHEVTGLDGSTVTRNEYDEAGRLTRVVTAAGTNEERASRTFYNAFGEVTATVGGEGDAALGANPTPQQIERVIRDFGVRRRYDTLGRMIRSIDANGNQTILFYDRENRRTHSINVIGQTADHSLAGEVSESVYNTFSQPELVRRYAARLGNADMDELLAAGGGGLAGEVLLRKLAALADPSLDQVSRSQYDRCGRLVKQIDGENGFTENIYSAFGDVIARVRSIRTGQTTTSQLDYDLLGRVVSQTDDVGGINANRRTDYDAFGRVVRTIDAAGEATTTAYLQNGRDIVVTDPLRQTTRTEYDALGRMSRLTDALGQQTVRTYDDAARKVTVITPAGRKVTTARTRHGETQSFTDGRGHVTRYGFNRDGQATTVTDPLGQMIARTTYDKSGRRVEATDARGTVTRFRYDQRNRVIEQRADPADLNLTTLFAFDALGQQVRVTEAAGTAAERLTTYRFDRKGRTNRVVLDAAAGGLQLCTTYEYDNLDNLVTVSRGTVARPNQHVMQYEFDNLGRRVTEIAAPSSVFGAGAPGTRDLTTLYRYDANGRLTRLIDRRGLSSWQVHDANGQLTFTISARGEVTESRYDAAGRLTSSRGYLNRLPSIVLDGFGDAIDSIATPPPAIGDRRSYVIDDADGRARFSLKSVGPAGWMVGENRYDANGNVIEARMYDRLLPAARVAELDSAASPGITLAEIAQELSTLGYQDANAATLIGVPRTFTAYDANDRLRFTVDPSGSVTESVYDSAGTVQVVERFAVRPSLAEHTEAAIDAEVDRGNPANRVTRYAYDAASRLRYTVDALGSVTETDVDARGNVVTTVRWAMRPALTRYTESAIAAALPALSAASDQVTRLVYDAANRVRFTIAATGSAIENSYDAVGNVVVTTRFAQRPVFQPGSFTEASVAAALVPLRNNDENQVTRFAYDSVNRLRFTVDALGSVTESVYDASGNLLASTRYAARPTLTKHDEGAIGAAVAPLQADRRNRITRFAYDAINRLRFTVDALGSVRERLYDALGNTVATERFAARPLLREYSESAVVAGVTPHRGEPGNRVEHHLHDALGRVRYSVLRLSVEAGQSFYRVAGDEFNALGQPVISTAYVSAVPLAAIKEEAIAAAVGAGKAGSDSVTRFVFDIAGRQIYRMQAVSMDGARLTYRVSAQSFDAFGQVVGTTDYATTVALDAFDKASVDAAVRAVDDAARDRVSAVAYDALGQPIYSVRVLSPKTHQVIKREYDPLGRVCRTTRCANVVGALAHFDFLTIDAAVNAVASVKDRQTQSVYDAGGRQRFVLEADKAGHWTVAESRYDAFDNPIESRRYDRYLTDAVVDALGPAGAREDDVIGQLTALGYSDAAPGSLARIQRTRFAHDRRNRLRFTIDALGGVAENVYDALGDLTTTVRFAAPSAPPKYTEEAIDAAVDRSHAGNRLQHVAYDAVGQLRFTVEVIEPNVGSGGKHCLSDRRYDALGQLVERREYATEVGHLAAYDETTLAATVVPDVVHDRRSVVAYDSGGRQVFAVRQLRVGAADTFVVSKQVQDALGQLVQRIDYATPVPLTTFDGAGIESATQPSFQDRTTTYVHDAAGRVRFEILPDLSFRESKYDALDQMTQAAQFRVTAPSHAPRTELEMAALRGAEAVGDGVTRGKVPHFDAGGRPASTVDALGNTERYEYDALGDRPQWTDKNGNSFACVYDRKGRKIVETTPPLQFKLRGEDPATPAPNRVLETRLEYDAFGNLIRKIEAANFATDAVTTEYSFDTTGRPVGTLSAGFYDAATGSVERDPAAGRFKPEATIVYDPQGNAVRTGSRMGANAFEHTWRTYDSQGRVVHEINALNNVTKHTYNAFGERETTTPFSLTISGTPQNGVYWTSAEVDPKLNFGVDELGHVVEDAFARKIRLAYDTLGRKSVVTPPTARYYSTQMPGDASQANPFRPNPPEGVFGVEDAAATRYEYDAFGDVILQRVRANTIVEWQDTAFTFDTMGRQIRSLDAAGKLTVSSYDTFGNLVLQQELTGQPDGTDRITGFAYNALNQQIVIERFGLRYTDANGVEHGVAFFTFENGGQWVDPDADVATTVRTTSYDGYDRPLVVTDAMGNVTSMRYDALGHAVEVIAPARPIAPIDANGENAVDPFRNQLTETLVTSMTLDPFGRAVRQERATSHGGDTRQILQSYDIAGNLVSTADATGNVKRRACDPAGRVIRETQAIHADLGPLGINEQGLERRYVYDAIGQLSDTLDVYVDVDGTDRLQSGKSAVYNAFGEVVEERRKWGFANQGPAALNRATVARYEYDNAGHVFDKTAADGLTVYFYNLLGQVTREEKRGNSNPTDGSDTRITETQYDVLGRATMIRRPAFKADITPGTGTTTRLVTPYSSRTLDRWGNVVGTEEGGYEFVNGRPSFAPFRLFRGYGYDDNSKVISETLGTFGFVSSGGVSTNALMSKRTFRDLLGNVVKDVDEARDLQSDALISSRTSVKQYDSVGRVTAEIDATNRKVEYAYSVHGERLGTRNARGTVLFDRYDANGSVRFHGVLRTAGADGAGEYDSHAGTGTPVRTYLKAFLYDQANRRFASKSFADGANAPLAYTWLDGRNLGVKQRDVMGIVTTCSYDQFGNKAVEIDGANARTEFESSTADFAVARIEKFRLPADTGQKFGQNIYNDFGEVKVHTLGNARTEYERHPNGLVSQVTIRPDTLTSPNLQEITRYEYDVRGQLTMEGRIDSDSIQTKMISYDNQGRLSRVEQSKAPNGATCDARYSYDEFNNVRRIQAQYSHRGTDGPFASDSWFDYDAAGRMTIGNGALVGGVIRLKARTTGSVEMAYDNVGRRRGTTEFARRNTAPTPTFRTWDTMRDERYAYDDLGHLRKIEQRIRQVNIVDNGPGGSGDPQSKPDRNGPWRPQSNRTVNLRGDVTRAEQFTRIISPPNILVVDMVADPLGTTATSYRDNGQPISTKTDATDPKNSTEIQNTYDALRSLLDSYVFKASRSNGVPFSTTFQYRYTFQNGQRVVERISDGTNGLVTAKFYDVLGRLASERVDLQKPNDDGGGSDRFENRFYEYGADGRIIFKDTGLHLTASGPNTVPLPTPSTGQQTYVYAGNRVAGTVGVDRLDGMTQFDFAYRSMSEAGGSGASHYVVQNGDSLLDIAQATYGDSALWYLVADANGIAGDPGESLPTTEVGKAYEIPDAVRSRQTASTFTPYGMAEIIGNDRPIAIPPPAPPRYSDIELWGVAAVSITIQVGVSIGLSELGPIGYAIATGLSSLGGQATSWALGMQDGIDWGGAGLATIEGGMFSAAGPAGALSRELWQQGKSGFGGWTNFSGIAGSLFNVGFDALGRVLDRPMDDSFRDLRNPGPFKFGVAGLINSAFNPSSGWAIPGSGRNPAVGGFDFVYGMVAQGLAIGARDRLKQRRGPVRLQRSMRGVLDMHSEFLSSAEGVATPEAIADGPYSSADGRQVVFRDSDGMLTTLVPEVIEVDATYSPFRAAIARAYQTAKEKAETLSELDVDGNGKLSGEELIWGAQCNERFARVAADLLFPRSNDPRLEPGALAKYYQSDAQRFLSKSTAADPLGGLPQNLEDRTEDTLGCYADPYYGMLCQTNNQGREATRRELNKYKDPQRVLNTAKVAAMVGAPEIYFPVSSIYHSSRSIYYSANNEPKAAAEELQAAATDLAAVLVNKALANAVPKPSMSAADVPAIGGPTAPRALPSGIPVPSSGGVPAVAGVDDFVPGVRSATSYEATATRRFDDRLFSGDFAPRSPLVANMSGGGDFTGGRFSVPASPTALEESALRVQIVDGLETASRNAAVTVRQAVAGQDVAYLGQIGLTPTEVTNIVTANGRYARSLGRAMELATARTVREDPFLSLYVEYNANAGGRAARGTGKPDWFINTPNSRIPVELSTRAQTDLRLDGAERGLFSYQTKWYVLKGLNLTY